MRIVITMPVFEDWDAAALLCAMIDDVLAGAPDLAASILMIDDGSIHTVPPTGYRPQHLNAISLLTLRRNVGHQRAIAIALAYIQENLPCDAVVVMDADGEDRPEDILRLVDKFRSSRHPVAVFAERNRRLESLKFKFFYQCYRALHRLVTGSGISIGNFSLLPARHLKSVVTYSELWNHYAATVVNSKLEYVTIRADRGARLHGESHMNFVALVIHGLSALLTYHEVVSVRLLLASGFLAFIFCLLLVIVVFVRFGTSVMVPGWATLASGLLFLVVMQCLATSVVMLFSTMVNRSAPGFLPARDYSFFVSDYREIASNDSAAVRRAGA